LDTLSRRPLAHDGLTPLLFVIIDGNSVELLEPRNAAWNIGFQGLGGKNSEHGSQIQILHQRMRPRAHGWIARQALRVWSSPATFTRKSRV